MSKIGKRAGKAYAAGAVAALGVLGTALADGAVSSAEFVAVIGSAIAAWATTYFVPNGAEPNLKTSTPQVGG